MIAISELQMLVEFIEIKTAKNFRDQEKTVF